MSSLSDLLTAPTRDAILALLLNGLKGRGLPVISWQPGTIPRHLPEREATFLESLAADIASIAASGLLAYCPDNAWLDLLTASAYDELRKPAVFAEGTVRLTDAGGVGPVTIAAGTYWGSLADGTFRFKNTSGGTLPLNGTLDIAVRAESVGALYNLPNGVLSLLNPTIAGVQLSNAGTDAASLARGSWLSVQGVDLESGDALKARCRAKWATLTGLLDDAYRYWILSASPEVSRVRVTSTVDGIVQAWFAGLSGPVSDTAAAAVQAVIAAKKPLAIRVIATPCRARVSPVAGTLYLAPGADRTAATVAAQQAVQQLGRSLLMGDIVYLAALVEAVMSAPGAINCVLTPDPLADSLGNLQLAPDEVVVFSNFSGLTVV